MAFSRIADYISSLIDWDAEEQKEFLLQCSIKKFSKGKVVQKLFEPSDNLYFILKGVLVTTIAFSPEEQKVLYISLPGTFATAWPSFLLNVPNNTMEIVAHKETECVMIPHTALNWLFEHTKEGETFGKLLYQKLFTINDKRVSIMYEKSLQNRYALMLDLYPGIENCVSQKTISDFLGVSQEHLSRQL